MTTILTIIHVLVCVFLIGIVLLQQGKGANMGAAFGGGSSQTVFGADGPMSMLSKVTTASAVIFMVTSLSLAYISSHSGTMSIMSNASAPQTEETKPASIDAPIDLTETPKDAEQEKVVE